MFHTTRPILFRKNYNLNSNTTASNSMCQKHKAYTCILALSILQFQYIFLNLFHTWPVRNVSHNTPDIVQKVVPALLYNSTYVYVCSRVKREYKERSFLEKRDEKRDQGSRECIYVRTYHALCEKSKERWIFFERGEGILVEWKGKTENDVYRKQAWLFTLQRRATWAFSRARTVVQCLGDRARAKSTTFRVPWTV